MSIKVLISDKLSEQGVEILKKEKDLTVDIKTGLTPEELNKIIPEYDAILVRSGTKVTKDVLEAGKKLKIVGRAGVGVDNVDVSHASKKGIFVVNAPEGNTISTAEQTMALMLALSRKLPWAHNSMQEGKWDRKTYKGNELYDKTIGVIGLGRIGKEVAHRCKAFGMRIFGFDPYLPEEQAEILGIKLSTLDDIFKDADIITVHTPLTDQTKGMISTSEIKKMKPGVLLINAARGGIMVEEDIAKALKEGKIGGAAFDVYSSEPPKEYIFKGIDNCITTPHLGASTSEAQVNVAVETASVIVDFFKKGVARNAVNYPSIAPDLYQEIKHHVTLSEKQGKLLSALIQGKIKEVNILYQGEMAEKAIHIMKLSVLKGILEPILSEATNFLNAPIIAKERGINVNVMEKEIDNDYVELVRVELKTDKAEACVTGTVHQHGEFRIITVNNYDFDFKPEGNYIMVKQKDKPGVVGVIGTILGNNNINIAEIQLSRADKGGEAITFIHVDSEVDKKILDELKTDDKIIEASVVNFD